MPRKLSEEGKDFNQLRGMGFEFESPQDEYSYQPGSGGSAGGLQGEQEYGIDTNLDSTAKRGAYEAGRSEELLVSDNKLVAVEKILEKQSDQELLAFLLKRLKDHPHLNTAKLDIRFDNSHKLIVHGEVSSSSDIVRLKELIDAIVGARKINFDVRIAEAD